MKFILRFPLFLLIFVLYNLLIFANRGAFQEKDSPGAAPSAAAVAPAGDPSAETSEAGTAPDTAAETPGTPAAPGADASSADAKPVPRTANHPLDRSLFTLPLPSGARWAMSLNDMMLILAILLLYVELFKATKTGSSTVIEHVFSLLVFLAFFIEFLMAPAAGTSTFALITLLSFLDVIAGFTITISTARRDFGLGAHGADMG